LDNLWHDVKHSLRSLFKSPGFTIAVVATLTLGIGTNIAIFSVVNAVLLKSLTYPDADRIVEFMLTSPQGNEDLASPTEFNNWVQQTSAFKDVVAYDYGGPGFNLTGDHPEQIHGIHVSEPYFRLFGAPIILGRTFTRQEDSPNGGKVVVLSYGLWQRRFGGNPHIIGSALSLGKEPYTVIGVLGKPFVSDPEADVLVPFQIDPNSTNVAHYFHVAGRLKPGVTLAQANAQLKLVYEQYLRRYPDTNTSRDGGFVVEPLRDSIVSDVRSSLFVLLGAVGLVLLIACANVANLLLVRASGRKREFAIRIAMGATHARIIYQLLTESILLAMTGGILGLILGYAGVRGLLILSPGNIPRIGEHGGAVDIDWRVLAFTLAISLLTGILFGLFPAIGASRTDLNSTLKESSNRSGTGFHQSRTRSLLVVSEVSLAIILLIGAALLIRTFVALRNVNPGFNSHNVLTMEMSLTGDRYQKTAGVAQLAKDGRERLNAIPGVEASAAVSNLPFEGGFVMPFIVVGRPLGKGHRTGGAGWMNTSPGYFDVLKIPILRGRDFKDSDTTGAPGVVLINEAMKKTFWPKEDPLGKQIILGKGIGPQFEEPARQIIGIVGDIRDIGLNLDPRPLMIIPQAQVTDGITALNDGTLPIVWVVRTRTDPHQFMVNVPEQICQASEGLPVARIRSMEEVLIHSTALQDFNMLLLTIFGASALILAAIGIYGLMTHSVQQRTQEMGIRIALGADRYRIRNLVVWQGMQLVIIGVILGIGAAFGLARLIAGFLFGVKPYDAIVFVTIPVVLSAVALFAVWLPATRASRLDPMESLRVE
jgi:putative ABC transport system permease protein